MGTSREVLGISRDSRDLRGASGGLEDVSKDLRSVSEGARNDIAGTSRCPKEVFEYRGSRNPKDVFLVTGDLRGIQKGSRAS